MKPGKTSYGYLYVHLWKYGKAKFYYVHRLVASAFCENQEGYTEVNHRDEDKTNNCVENLEYCSRSYNLTYNDRAKRVGKKTSKPVIGIDKISGLIVEFSSINEASRQTGINQGNIVSCCKGKLKSCGEFYWMYANNNDAE